MNRRIVRNGLLVLGLCAVATLMPAKESLAQTPGCHSQACEACVANLDYNYNVCVYGCAVIGGPGCPDVCSQVYQANLPACFNM